MYTLPYARVYVLLAMMRQRRENKMPIACGSCMLGVVGDALLGLGESCMELCSFSFLAGWSASSYSGSGYVYTKKAELHVYVYVYVYMHVSMCNVLHP